MMSNLKLGPYELDILEEMERELNGKANAVFSEYRAVIEKLGRALPADEIAEKIIKYSNKGVSPEKWIYHIASIDSCMKPIRPVNNGIK